MARIHGNGLQYGQTVGENVKLASSSLTQVPLKSCFWQIFVEALVAFPIVIIQSRNSASIHEHSENCHASFAQ